MSFKLLCLMMAVLAVSSLAQTSKDDEAVLVVIQKMVAAQIDYDPKTLDALYTDDFVEISPAGEYDTREKVLGFYKAESKPDPAKMTAKVEVGEHSIRNYGKFAIAIVRFDYTMTADGKPMPKRGLRATVVLKKTGADWKIASTHYTGIRPPAPPKPN